MVPEGVAIVTQAVVVQVAPTTGLIEVLEIVQEVLAEARIEVPVEVLVARAVLEVLAVVPGLQAPHLQVEVAEEEINL